MHGDVAVAGAGLGNTATPLRRRFLQERGVLRGSRQTGVHAPLEKEYARKDGSRVRLYSRPGNDLTHRFPLIVEAMARLPEEERGGGALLGRAIDTRGERATGTILGAAAGALLGRSVDRNRVRCG